MKTINVKNVSKLLSNKEMKCITGGWDPDDPNESYDDGDGDGGGGSGNICAASRPWSAPAQACFNNAWSAIEFAGMNGWWCCNCQEAKDFCG